MADLRKGIIGVILTVISVILEFVLFPLALTFQSAMNDSAWLTASDRALLQRNSTLMILIIIVTLIGGVMLSVYVGIAGGNKG